MCANPNLFLELKRTLRHVSVKLADKRIKEVTQEGSVGLSSKIILENVLYIPSFKYNLISVNKLTTTTQSKFIFFPTYCLLEDQKTEHILLRGKAVGSLYVFYDSGNNDVFTVNQTSTNISHLYTWHRRLAHTPLSVMQYIKFLEITPSISRKHIIEMQTCEACHKAKQSRLPFLIRTSNVSGIFELLHVDIWALTLPHL